MKKKCFLKAVFLIIPLLSLSTQNSDNLLYQISVYEQLVLEHNRDLATLKRQIKELGDSVTKIIKLENSSISINGNYAYDSVSEDSHIFSGSAAITIPLIDQLHFSGGLDTDGNGILSLLCTPLVNLPKDTFNEQQLALLQLEYLSLQQQLCWQSRILLLYHAHARQEQKTAEQFKDLHTRKYNNKLLQYEAGLCSLSDLQALADTLSSSTIEVINAAQLVSVTEQDMLQLISKPGVLDPVPDYTIDSTLLQEMITHEETEWKKAASVSAFSTFQVQSLLVTRHYIKKQLKNRWFIEPQLSLSGTIPVQNAFTPSVSTIVQAGISLEFSVSDFYLEEKKELEQQYDDCIHDLALARDALKITEQSLTGSLEAAVLSAEIAERHLQIMKKAAGIADLDLEENEVSNFEYEEIQLNKQAAENNYISTLINVYEKLSFLLRAYIY